MTLGHSIHVADLKLPKGVEAATHGTHTLKRSWLRASAAWCRRSCCEAEAEPAAAAAPAAKLHQPLSQLPRSNSRNLLVKPATADKGMAGFFIQAL